MYGDRENTKWFSQTLMTHKDKMYGTDGYMKISIITNTVDYKYFNQPSLSVSIQNNYQKSYNINYHNACDLLNALKLVKTQSNGNKSEIQRKYQKNMMLYVLFFVESNNNDSVVDIRLMSSETDFTKIIIPIEIFSTFARCLKYYVENYFDLCTKLLIQSTNYESNNIIQQLPSLIKGISGQIISNEVINDNQPPEVEEEKVEQTQATIEDLDSFLGDNMKNIDIPEIKEEKIEKEKPVVEVDSIFVKHVLKNDLSNLESMINNHSMNHDPIRTFTDELQNILEPQTKSELSILPGVSDDEIKSLLYLSKVFYSTAHINNIIKNEAIPPTIPIFKYTGKNETSENLDLAYDMFLFSSYIKTLRGRIESKNSDITVNKALFHLQLRCFTDVITFSFIKKEHASNLESVIMNRYKYYDSIGVFDKYKSLLVDNKCPEIKDHDITSEVNKAIEHVLGITPDIKILHDKIPGFRLPSKNSFSLEQIINEIVPLEIAESTGKNIKDKSVMDEINKITPISTEIYNFFTKGSTKVKVKKDSTFKNNLERVVNFYSDEVPEQYRTDFIKYLSSASDTKFDLNDCEYPLDEFGDNVVRALYLWDPTDDPKITKSYKHFQTKIENELMEKELILAQIKSGVKEENESDEWGFLSD